MSKGTRIITFRIPPGLAEDMAIAIETRNLNPLLPPLTQTDFITKAIREKIEHGIRARRPKRKAKVQ